jgi:hypothetical protein
MSIKEEVTEEEASVTETKSATAPKSSQSSSSRNKKRDAQRDMYNERNNKPEVPDCDCFANDKKPPEPGSYYTHLGESQIFSSLLAGF